MKFFVPSDYIEEVTPIIKKLWQESGNDQFLLKRAEIKRYAQNRD